MARAGTTAVLLPGAFYVLREKQVPPVEAFAAGACPIAIATDSNPGTSPITSLLMTMNMAATLFRLTVDEAIAGVTREAARALGRLDRHRHARVKANGAISPSGTSNARPSSSIASASIRCMRGCGEAHDRAHAHAGTCDARRLARDR